MTAAGSVEGRQAGALLFFPLFSVSLGLMGIGDGLGSGGGVK